MLITDKFAFLHLPRAGGTFVYEVSEIFPSAREIGHHFRESFCRIRWVPLNLTGNKIGEIGEGLREKNHSKG